MLVLKKLVLQILVLKIFPKKGVFANRITQERLNLNVPVPFDRSVTYCAGQVKSGFLRGKGSVRGLTY